MCLMEFKRVRNWFATWKFKSTLLCQVTDDLIHWVLTHWGRVTHICVNERTIIGSDNDLAPTRQCWNIVNRTIRNNIQWKVNRNSYIFIHENAFENVVWKKAAMLSWPQCANWTGCVVFTKFKISIRTGALYLMRVMFLLPYLHLLLELIFHQFRKFCYCHLMWMGHDNYIVRSHHIYHNLLSIMHSVESLNGFFSFPDTCRWWIWKYLSTRGTFAENG